MSVVRSSFRKCFGCPQPAALANWLNLFELSHRLLKLQPRNVSYRYESCQLPIFGLLLYFSELGADELWRFNYFHRLLQRSAVGLWTHLAFK